MLRAVAVQNLNISKDIYDRLHKLTSNFLIQPLLTTVNHFLYVHIGFCTFTAVIRPNWGNYYNITNVNTALHLSQMERISGSHYFRHLPANPTLQHLPVTALSLYECKLVSSVFRGVNVGRIYSSVAQNVELDWSIQITWKHRASGKYD